MDTQEDDGSGSLYDVPAESWRAFYSWREAVSDFQERIAAGSGRYGRAHAALVDEDLPDSEYWAELGDAGYYTDTQNMTPGKFASLCRRVRSEVAQKKSDVNGLGLAGGFVLGVLAIVAGLAAVGVGIVRAHVR
jgi:flagellum-specific peptidoglycan hydrolase FlgJ